MEEVLGVAVTENTADSQAADTAIEASPAESFQADIAVGLTTEQVEQMVALGKVNGDQNVRTKSIAEILRTNLFTFFNLLFLILAIILAAFVRSFKDLGNFGFVGLVIVNLLIGIIQEIRAKQTIDKLSLITAPKVIVMREGKEEEISVSEIVLGDIMILTSGCQICADAVVVEGSVEVNESLITGEPDAVVKNVGDHVMSGSFVVSGKAATRVVNTGADNYAVKISAGAKYLKKPTSQILKSLNRIVKFMAVVIVPLGVSLFIMKYFVQKAGVLDETVKTVVGTLVGLIPSGLVALTSAVFCVSVIRLARHKTLAQDLYCVETLARVDVLCLDKTGTITEGEMQVEEVVSDRLSNVEFKRILKNLSAAIGDDNPTANAIKVYVAGMETTAKAVDAVAFSSARKWSGASFKDCSYAIGAAEFVFKKPSQEILERSKAYSERGFRVLVLVRFNQPILDKILPEKAEFLGYVLISDKIRAEAPATLKFFAEQGVQIKIISGDNPVTVKCVAERAGMKDFQNYIDASTIGTDEELSEAAEKYTIFGRVTPDQKLKLVKALRANGHTVAMTGDGVNDVLALKEADCSIAMAAGSDAAKNVSSLILLDSNFASMPKIVAEGRRSINNLERSSALFLVKTIYSMLFAVIFMIVPAELPFEPKHLTIIGTLTIGIPSFILALEPNKELITGKFLPKVVAIALPGSLTVVLSIVAVLIAGRFVPMTTAEKQAAYFMLTSFVSFIFLFKICMPFNTLRTFVFMAMFVAFIGSFFAEFPSFDLAEFFGLPNQFTSGVIRVSMAVGIIDIPLFLAMVYYVKFLTKRGFFDKLLGR